MQGAWKVGLMVVVFAVLVGFGLTFMGKVFGGKPVDQYYAILPDAGGVAKGAKLLMSGVKVGAVSAVALNENDEAVLTLDIDKGTKIKQGSAIRVPSSMLSLGDNPVMIVPGKGPALIAPGGTLRGAKSSLLETNVPEAVGVLGEAQATLKQMKEAIEALKKVALSEERWAKLDRLLESTTATSDQFRVVAGDVSNLMRDNRRNIAATFDSLQRTMKSVNETTALIAQMVKDGKYDQKIDGVLANLNSTTESAGKLVEDLRSFVNDPNLREPLNKTAQNVATITDSGTRIAADAEKMAANGVEITQKLNTFTEKANDLADSAKDALDSLKRIISKTPSADKIGLTASLDLLHESKPNRYRTDVEAGFNLGSTRIYAGLFDAFESNKITLQAGQPFFGGKGTVRYGIYASKPGLGVEYEIARGLALRGDLFDINNPRADIRARFDLGGGFYGWLGGSQVFKRNALTVGVGFRK